MLNQFSHERLQVGSKYVRLGISRNNQYVACGSKDGSVVFYDMKAGEVEDIMVSCHKQPVVACEWQPRCQEQSPTMATVDANGCFIGWVV